MNKIKIAACAFLALGLFSIGQIQLSSLPCWIKGYGVLWQSRQDRINSYVHNNNGNYPAWAKLDTTTIQERE